MRTTKIGKVSTETTLEVRVTNRRRDTIRETNTTSTDTTITKTETGLITEEDQTNTNTIKINIKHMMEMMQTIRGFINLIKANPTTRDHYKTNKLANRKYDNKVNESEIKTSNLEQVQQFFNKDADVIFDALVAADYINEINCTDGIRLPSA